MLHGLTQSVYDSTIKDVTIKVLFDRYLGVSFSDYDEPADSLLWSKNVNEEVETK